MPFVPWIRHGVYGVDGWKKSGESLQPRIRPNNQRLVGLLIFNLANLQRPNRRGHPKWWFSKGIHPKMALN